MTLKITRIITSNFTPPPPAPLIFIRADRIDRVITIINTATQFATDSSLIATFTLVKLETLTETVRLAKNGRDWQRAERSQRKKW